MIPIIIVSCNIPKSSSSIIEVGRTITTDKMEFTVYQSFIAQTADSYDLGINFELPAKNDSIYFIILGQIKNISSTAISLIDNVDAKLIFDGKFEYDVFLEPSVQLKSIVPLSSEQFVFFASVPLEILNTTQNFEYSLRFQKGISKGKEQFYILGKTSQYYSYENIVNFRTFYERIVRISSKYSGFSISVVDETKSIILSWDDLLFFEYPDAPKEMAIDDTYKDRFFDFRPELFIQYLSFIGDQGSSEEENSGYVSLAFASLEITATYSSAEELTLILNSTPIPHDEKLSYKMEEIDNYTSTFFFRSNEKLEKLSGIDLNDDLKIHLKYFDAGAGREYEDWFKDHEITGNEKWKNAISTLLAIYREFDSTVTPMN